MLVFATSMAFVVNRSTSTNSRGLKRKILGRLRMMKSLPSNVVKYSQVPKAKANLGTSTDTGTNSDIGAECFTANKIPKGLLKEHSTKAGTWGIIKVLQGKLLYTINEPSPAEYVLDKDRVGVIEPAVKHEVAPLSDDLQFVVEFYRIPGTGPVDEKREGV
jgi:tellurite resistance-related uncharacterized protein